MNARILSQALPLALMLSAGCAELAAADQGARLSIMLAQAPGTAASPPVDDALYQGQPGSPSISGCPAGTDENICATLRRPLPSSVPRRGPVVTQGITNGPEIRGLTDQQTLRGMSLGK